MSTFVFLGPSLEVDQARGILDACYLPPVSQGEVYELVHARLASRIAIIDGHFNQVPAVWHKELLHALSQGVQVYGASSMGALRAAELERFGMQGVGVIFQAYRDGRYPGFPDQPFQDDDEVALVHAPGEVGYRAASESMVNIRSTLNAARAAGVIDDQAHTLLARCAKARFYPERGLDALLHDGLGEGMEAAALESLRRWWARSRVNQKANDARALLAQLASPSTGAPAVSFQFEHTCAFDGLARAARHRRACVRNTELAAVLDELRLLPRRFKQLHAGALARILGVEARAGDDADSLVARRARRDLGIESSDGGGASSRAEALLVQHDHEQRLGRFAADIPASVLDAHLSQQLLQAGEYDALAQRAASKACCLARQHSIPAVHALHGLEILQLEQWYFGRVLDEWIPDDVNAHAMLMGFGSLSDFHRALIAEYLYRQEREPADAV